MNSMGFIQPPSPFAQLVDRLRDKSEAELKALYLQFFKAELADEWKKITEHADFGSVSEDEIIKRIQQKRYPG